jgi:carboxylesterase
MMGGLPIGTLDVPGSSPSVLALHGFGATPQEVQLVVDVARQLGLRALAPLLPGHGLSVQDLAQTRWHDWRKAAGLALEQLVAEGGPVIVVGSSMGSLLALDLAADFPEHVLGVAALAPAIRLGWPFPSLALALVCGLGVPDFCLPKSHSDILDSEARRSQVTYPAQPAYAGNEVRLAGRRVARRLSTIRCPAFVAHGQADHVCPVRNARQVYAALGSPAWEKELLILPRSYHIITRDVERELLRARLLRFIERLVSGRSSVASGAPDQAPVEPYPPVSLEVSERLRASST